MLNALRKGFGLTFKTIFRSPVTVQYPDVKRDVQPRYHGRHVLNRHEDGLEKCVGCELCAWACPADAIYVVGADNRPDARYSPAERYGVDYQINYLRCIFCGLCIEACPTRALTMSHEYELSGDRREDFVFVKEQLLAPLPEGAKPPPHTDAEVAARDLDYYRGHAGQDPLRGWKGSGEEDLASVEEHGDPVTVSLLGGGTEPPRAHGGPSGRDGSGAGRAEPGGGGPGERER